MRAGQLRHRLTVERRVMARDPRGQDTESWATRIANLPAKVTRVTARERERGQIVAAEADWRITTRYVASIETTDRIQFEGRALDILSIVDVEGRKTQLHIEAKEHIASS